MSNFDDKTLARRINNIVKVRNLVKYMNSLSEDDINNLEPNTKQQLTDAVASLQKQLITNNKDN